MNKERRSTFQATTVECLHCSDAGDLYELKDPDRTIDSDVGVSHFMRVKHEWVMTGDIRE